jgi:indolepyruvate ferredoxin oxidoreductase beta subunit
VQEVADTLPAPLGRWLLNSGAPRRWLAAFTSQGRVVQTHSLRGFLLLRVVAACAGFRRHSLRFQAEQARIEAWLNDVAACLPQSLELAREVAQAQGLIKGYGDTHERGWRHFELLQARWRAHPAMPPQRLRQLRLAALADEEGVALRQALAQEEGTPA